MFKQSRQVLLTKNSIRKLIKTGRSMTKSCNKNVLSSICGIEYNGYDLYYPYCDNKAGAKYLRRLLMQYNGLHVEVINM